MPLCTIHLLSLKPSPDPLPTFLSTLSSTSLKPLVISRVIRWIILPTSLSTDTLLAQNIHWDLLLILLSTSPLPSSLQSQIAHQWSVTAGIPSRLLADFHAKNKNLLHPNPSDVPPPSGSLTNPQTADSTQHLELSPELQSWIRTFTSSGSAAGKGAVSMLNLLAFKENMKPSYLQYGAAFAKSIGSKRGGAAKLVGTVVGVVGKEKTKKEGEGEWDEIALAHYPSILHFADMLAGEDYQRVNKEFRVPALRDTFILCTSEIAVEEVVGMKGGSKL
ncbi:hypothetical protein M011DRAFT_465116 [Sporormia fimetaria CBS 119925]|uniref:DUF1330 domain-containing protein n=1 Tax=Sporormia fimetaria CBS 119925 TaxID=1340428 RepID=A0A6A6VLB8_9PLEO|nr:hypothetical protein M011DRAFT_465116 [Sporormia fimetaria CBS 119925]